MTKNNIKIQNQNLNIDNKSILKNFIKYIRIDTQSDPDSNTIPSTEKQKNLIKILKEDLQKIGIKKIKTSKNGFLYTSIPSNIKNSKTKIGLIAHVDTASDSSGKNVKPKIWKNYDGKDILLNKTKNIILSPKQFPELKKYKNQTIITTDGTTLLGSDDKSGIAEIIEVIKILQENPNLKHPEIKIAFTPDEEIGKGAHHFDLKYFDADFAYTIDGGEIGEIEWETFNAAITTIIIEGINVHPGYAYKKMINSQLIANEIVSEISDFPSPENTRDYEGYLYLYSFQGNTEKTTLKYLIRDHNKTNFNKKKKILEKIIKKYSKKYKKAKITIETKDQYYNMAEKIKPVKFIVDYAKKAIKDSGLKVKEVPVRGGTDGSILSFRGLPTPNIFAGGHNFHGIYEYVPLESMEKSVEVILRIILENIKK